MLEKLRQLGWSEYEARAYVALLRLHSANGYRVGKESGVPTAKVYEALARLVERGAARLLPAAEGETAQYLPVPPDEVLAGLRARHTQMLDELSTELSRLFIPAGDTPPAEWLEGRAPVLGRANALLALAQKSVALAMPSGWESGVREALEAARGRGVRVERVAVGPEGSDFVLVVDGTTALVGMLGDAMGDAATRAFATETPFLVRLCADYVRLRRAVALVPEAVARLQRQDGWLDWEEAKQRRLLQRVLNARSDTLPGTPN